MSAPYGPNNGEPASAQNPPPGPGPVGPDPVGPDPVGPDFEAPPQGDPNAPPHAAPYGPPSAPAPAYPYGPPPGTPYGPPPPPSNMSPPPYGPAPVYGGAAFATTTKTNGLCIASLVCGLGGLFTGVFLAGIAGVICGHKGMSQSKQRGEDGHGLAIAGLITGYLQIFGLLAIIALIVSVVVAET